MTDEPTPENEGEYANVYGNSPRPNGHDWDGRKPLVPTLLIGCGAITFVLFGMAAMAFFFAVLISFGTTAPQGLYDIAMDLLLLSLSGALSLIVGILLDKVHTR